MNIEKRKIAAILFTLFNLYITAIKLGLSDGFMIWLMYHIYLPLPLIFFSKELGSLTGIGYLRANRPVDKPSPPCLVEFMGWVFLLIYLFMMNELFSSVGLGLFDRLPSFEDEVWR